MRDLHAIERQQAQEGQQLAIARMCSLVDRAGHDPAAPRRHPKPPPIWARYAIAKSDFEDAAERLSFARELGMPFEQELADFKRCDAECVAARDELKELAERERIVRTFAEPIDFDHVEWLAERMEREQQNRIRVVRHYPRRKPRVRSV